MTPPAPLAPSALDRSLRLLAPIGPGEAGVLLRSAAIFFCVLTGYYVVRPVRENIGATLGPDNLQWLFVVVFVVMIALVPAFGWLVQTVARRWVLPAVYGFLIANLLGFWFAFSLNPAHPGSLAASAFFVWVSVYNLFVVSLFWSLASELYSSEQAKRLFGFVAAGGSLGALAGPILARELVSLVSPNNLLLITVALLTAALIGAIDLRRVFRRISVEGQAHDDEPAGKTGLLAGMKSVLTSRYLSLIALYVLFANLVGTYFYLEQIRIVADVIPDQVARVEFFATRDLIVGVLSILLQLFVTARMLQWFGPGVALAVLPLSAGIGLLAISVTPTLYVVAAIMVAERAIAFGLTNPAMKVLYTVVTPEEKYKSQNFIDTVVYRGGDAASGWLLNSGAKAIGLAGVSLAIVTMPIAIAWFAIALILGRRHADNARGEANQA